MNATYSRWSGGRCCSRCRAQKIAAARELKSVNLRKKDIKIEKVPMILISLFKVSFKTTLAKTVRNRAKMHEVN